VEGLEPRADADRGVLLGLEPRVDSDKVVLLGLEDGAPRRRSSPRALSGVLHGLDASLQDFVRADSGVAQDLSETLELLAGLAQVSLSRPASHDSGNSGLE